MHARVNSHLMSQTSFDAPAGDEPLGLNLGSMGKGGAWVNGRSIGRYWVSFLTPQGSPYQTWYVFNSSHFPLHV